MADILLNSDDRNIVSEGSDCVTVQSLGYSNYIGSCRSSGSDKVGPGNLSRAARMLGYSQDRIKQVWTEERKLKSKGNLEEKV